MSESFRPNPTDRPDPSPAKPGENDNIISFEDLPPPPLETRREIDGLNPSSSTAELPDGQNQPEEIQQKQTEQELIEKTKKELDRAFQAKAETGSALDFLMANHETGPRRSFAPESAESLEAKKQLQQEIDKLHYAVKSGERLPDTQMEDFIREAAKLDPLFARNLPARGLELSSSINSIDGEFKDLFNHLDHEFAGRYWGSFYAQGVEQEKQPSGLGYPAKNHGFMVIGTPGKPFNRENLSAVLIPRHYESLSDPLRRAYPEVKFITVDEIKDLPTFFRNKNVIPPADLPPPPPEIDAFGLNITPKTAEVPADQNQQEVPQQGQIEPEQRYQEEKPALTAEAVANLEHLRDQEQILDELNNLNKDYHLIIHQTDGQIAQEIMTEQKHFSDTGLNGTSLLSSPERIAQLLPELDKPTSERRFQTHQGSNGLLIMGFPKKLTRDWQQKNLNRIDDFLLQQQADKKTSQWGLPPEAIYGYYTKGELVKNPKFGPKFE